MEENPLKNIINDMNLMTFHKYRVLHDLNKRKTLDLL